MPKPYRFAAKKTGLSRAPRPARRTRDGPEKSPGNGGGWFGHDGCLSFGAAVMLP